MQKLRQPPRHLRLNHESIQPLLEYLYSIDLRSSEDRELSPAEDAKATKILRSLVPTDSYQVGQYVECFLKHNDKKDRTLAVWYVTAREVAEGIQVGA